MSEIKSSCNIGRSHVDRIGASGAVVAGLQATPLVAGPT